MMEFESFLTIWIIGNIIFFIILYFVIKAAVLDAIVEAFKMKGKDDNSKKEGYRISQIVCPKCGKKHDIDYPQCPYCGYNSKNEGTRVSQTICPKCGKAHDLDYPKRPHCGTI